MAEINDIITAIKEIPVEELYLNYSFGRKSSLLAWCAIQAGKKVTLHFIRAKKRMFPEILHEIDKIILAWEKLGCKIEIIDIECNVEDTKSSPCGKKMITFRKNNLDKSFLVMRTPDAKTYHRQKVKIQNCFYPLENYTDAELYRLRNDIPSELYLDLAKFDCPHICANPICPYWKTTRPESLTKFKRWTDAKTG